ncbi:MAG: hypothetical protein PHT40_01650 [Patescibacteria group bacterium]|nr:hypothetical protein [Patescibacteria group bacterium]
MFSPQLEKIIDLAKRTGDKMIVVPEFGEPFAIVPLEKYEEMVSDQTDYAGMTEEEILNRVNREISLWKQAQREIGLGTDMDFFSPRDLGEDFMPRLPFDNNTDFNHDFNHDRDLFGDREEDIFGKKTFDPLADDDDDDENPPFGEASWTPPKWPEDFMDKDLKMDEEKDLPDVFKEKTITADESVFPVDDEPLDDEWLNETTVGDVNYEAEKPAEVNKDLPIIEADAENGEVKDEKKDVDEFLVEPIE